MTLNHYDMKTNRLHLAVHTVAILLSAAVLQPACTAEKEMDGIILFKMEEKDNIMQIPADSLFEKISVTVLENGADAPILGNIYNVCESDSSYFIVSEGILYEYGKDGRFIRKIGNKGRGPGEYLFLRGTGIDGNALYLFDYNTQTILEYGKDGKFSQSRKLDFSNSDIRISSFFPDGKGLILFSSSNSTSPDLYRYRTDSGKTETISERNRKVPADEVSVGGTFIFGNTSTPYVYNYFNDTVYVLKNDKLQPSFLMKQDRYRFGYEELRMDKLINLSESRLLLRHISAAGDYIFIFYSVNSGNMSISYMALYDTVADKYFQNVSIIPSHSGNVHTINSSSGDNISGTENDFTGISPSETLYKGKIENELLSVKAVSDNGDKYAVIRYRIKDRAANSK